MEMMEAMEVMEVKRYYNPSMNADAQRSYNWTFGSVQGGLRMLPFLIKGLQMHGASDTTLKSTITFRCVLADAAEELHSLASYFNEESLREAACCLATASELLARCSDAIRAKDANLAESLLADAIADVSRAMRLMKEQSAVRYRLWLLNPWKYYPRRLAAALPPGSAPSLDQ